MVDVSPDNYTMDTALLEAAIERWDGPEQLRAIMPVHEFGYVADMEEINRIARRYNLAVVEDAACALGAEAKGRKAGTFGDIGCFSFHPRKTLTTGEGGAIVTNSAELATRMRGLRNHGMIRLESGVQFVEPATNYRLTNFQAALGRKQLPELDGWIQKRRELVEEYSHHLMPLVTQGIIKMPDQSSYHSWQTFMVVLSFDYDRNVIISKLKEHSVEANLGAQSLSSLALWGEQKEHLTVGPMLYRQGLALPLFEQMTSSDVIHVSNAITKVLREAKCS
jgi:dTDP-4-amino-4,6-dideoxygalactose transaminase